MGVKGRFLLEGGVRVEVRGFGAERFLNIAVQRGLTVCQVQRGRETEAPLFWTTVKDFKRMKPVARKAGVRLRIRGRSGLPFFLYRRRKRKLLAAGIVSFFLFLYGMSFFIWDISFEGNHRFTDQTLQRFLSTIPVEYGMRKSQISCAMLEEAVRNEFTEITWVSAEITGTRLIVRIKENEALLAPIKADETPCDLAAQKDGVIVKTVTRTGFCQVQAGDEVAAGDLLVSGTVPIYDDFDTLLTSHQVRADAEIYAKTIHTFKKRLPLTYTKRARTGKKRAGLFVECFGKGVHFLMPGKGERDWEYVSEQRQLKLFDDFYLPVYMTLLTAYEYVPYDHTYTEGELNRMAERYMEEYIENLDKKGIQILGKDAKIETSESGHTIRGTLTVVEDIAKSVPIPEKPEENQTINECN